jgi:lysophospholipase L1-like esterase
VIFTTDSPTIAARWTTSQSMPGVNMSAITQKGLDLYIRDGEEWVYAGVGRPTITAEKRDKHEYTIIANAPTQTKECLMYLPIWDRVESLEIGIEQGSSITAMENPFRHKIVVHGSSITHGASSSRSGMTYPALMERRTGLYMINLGYSGMSTLQEEFAHYLAQVESADAFLFDTFSNPSAEVIAERFDKFVDIIREKHPTTPLIFTQTIRRDTRNYNLKTEDFESRKQAMAEKKVRERMQRDEHIYFLDSKGWLADDHLATADGIHPTDLGFMRMLEHMEPAIKKILKKYGIK